MMPKAMVMRVSQRSGPHEGPRCFLDLCPFPKLLILSFSGKCRLIYSGLLPHFYSPKLKHLRCSWESWRFSPGDFLHDGNFEGDGDLISYSHQCHD